MANTDEAADKKNEGAPEPGGFTDGFDKSFEEEEGSVNEESSEEAGGGGEVEDDAEGGETPVEGTPEEKQEGEASLQKEDPQPKTEEPKEAPQQVVDWQKWRSAAEVEVEKLYALTDEDVAALEEDPRKVLPKLATRVYMDATEAAVRGVVNMLPAMVKGMLQTDKETMQAEQEFYKQWPDLRKHHSDVVKVATIYRATYPKASRAETVKDVGRQVSAMNNLGNATPAPPPKGLRSGSGSRPSVKSQFDEVDSSLADGNW